MKVVCIDVEKSYGKLILGKFYDARESETSYIIKHNNEEWFWVKSRFMKIDEWRNRQIEEALR